MTRMADKVAVVVGAGQTEARATDAIASVSPRRATAALVAIASARRRAG